MDWNIEEATRATKLAEEKMMVGDFVGAHKLVTKAQRLLANLENIHEMIAICDVHSNTKIDGIEEKDWYGILHVDPFADADTIEKQYRKLTMLLDPNKNKFAGAESAFKLVGEAKMVLSDKLQRALYHIKYRSFLSHAAKEMQKKPVEETGNKFSSPTAVKKESQDQDEETENGGEAKKRRVQKWLEKKKEEKMKHSETRVRELANEQGNPVYGWNIETIDQSIDQSSMEATQAVAVSQQLKSLVQEVDAIQMAVDKRNQELKSVETKIIAKIHELPTRYVSMDERESLKKHVAELKKRIPTKKTALSDAGDRCKRAQEELDLVLQQMTAGNEELTRIQGQIDLEKAKLESTKTLLSSVTQECHEKRTKADTLGEQVKLTKETLQTLKTEKLEIQKVCEDNEIELTGLEDALSHTEERYSGLQRQMADHLKDLVHANKSIHSRLSKRRKRS